MGNSQKTTVIDQNRYVKVKQDDTDTQLQKFVGQAFINVSENGFIHSHRFQEVLRILESFNMIRLRDTPLGSRLFQVMDRERLGMIKLESFKIVINQLMNDQEKRIDYTFKVYDREGIGRISLKDFVFMADESWLSAFRILGEQISLSYKELNLSAINNFAISNSSKVIQKSTQIFKQYDVMKLGYLDGQMFRQYVLDQQYNEMQAKYENLIVKVPMSLLSFKNN